MMLLGKVKAQHNNPFGNALIPDMIADASIQEINGVFYCYATTDGYGQGLKTSGPPVVWKSKDFVHWSFDGTYFPSAAKEKYWAPSKAIFANGKYYIYPTINGYMYPAVADKPEGPFKLARGKDEFYKPFTPSTLLQSKNPGGIDAEIFVDDDGQAYVFWGRRHVAKLNEDMITVDSVVQVISTPRKEYSEGPIFFKRKGIYYYLYTIGGDEKYQYAYVMSRVSPMGPFEAPEQDIISTTNYERGSAIRITHLPTGIVVQCQNERSQHQNKDKAMQMLKAKLYLLKEAENAENLSGIRGDVKDINFGSQIRSYVLQPYTMVKDNRTNKEVANAGSVLDGNIDPFINAYLTWISTGKTEE